MHRYGNTKVVMLAAALVFGSSLTVKAAEKLTVAIYGGVWGDTLKACILDPFTKQTGVTAIPEPGVSTATLAKLRQQKGDPAIDVAWMDGGISELALEADVVEVMDPAKVTGIANVVPAAQHKNSAGQVYALGTGYYALGLVYNTDEVKTPPTSWNDLWDSKYEDVVTVPSPTNAMGVPFVVLMSQMEGGSATNVKPGIAKIKKLKAAALFDTSGIATNGFQSGEMIIGAHYSSAAWAMADKGLPIGYAVPKEGVPSGDIRVHIVKGTKKKALAEQFVNLAVSSEAASCVVEKLYVGPASKGVSVSDKAAMRLPWGPGGSVKNLALFDWAVINAERDNINKIWNREIAGQ